LYAGLSAAKKAFYNFFEEEEIEGAFFEIELKGFVLDLDFNRLKSILVQECKQ